MVTIELILVTIGLIMFSIFYTPLGGVHVPQKLIKYRPLMTRFLVNFIPPARLPFSIFKGFSGFVEKF
jgi:hypothetical protein